MNTEQCTEITDNSIPLRQGDILFFDQKAESERYGIVVTGDCDITQKKCRRIISYCTITTAKYYISSEVLYDLCIKKEINILNNYILKNVCKILGAKESDTIIITLLNQDDEYLRTLLKDNELVNKICLLRVVFKKKEFSLDDYKNLFIANNNRDLKKDEIEKIKEKILSKLNSLPGDKYYISELPDQTDDFGYIVHLRFINTIPQDDIEKQSHLYRIGHLESPYLYRLTQKLGAVFSDIGEPEKFEKNRAKINKQICEEL